MSLKTSYEIPTRYQRIYKIGHFSYLLIALFVVTISACGGPPTWQDVAGIEMTSGDIQAGSLVRIEPDPFTPIELPGAEFSANKFTFKGTLLNDSKPLTLLGKVTLMAGEGDFHKTETQSDKDPFLWAVSDTQKSITITFINMPTGSSYAGEGFLYFYLTGPNGDCVSNIVAWPVKFS